MEKQGNLNFDPPGEGAKEITVGEYLDKQRLKGMAQLGVFHKFITDLTTRSNDPILSGMQARNLTDVDMFLFNRFQRGELEITDIRKQIFLLHTLPEDKAIDSRRLLLYMKAKLENRPH